MAAGATKVPFELVLLTFVYAATAQANDDRSCNSSAFHQISLQTGMF